MGSTGYDLLTDDEIRYAEAGRQMLETGNWIIPEYNGQPRYQKPILFYWLQAALQTLFGIHPWAARIPSALAGVGVVLLTAQLGKRLWGPRAGWWAGIALAVSVEMVLVSRMVLTDGLLLLCIQGGFTCFCLAQLKPHPPTPLSGSERGAAERGGHYRLMYLCFGLGVLAKGPIALVLPVAVLGPWLLLRRELRSTLQQMRVLEGLGIILLVAGPWYVLAHIQTDGEFTRHFFFEENVGRFTSTVNRHRQPAWFYFLLIVPMTFPWLGILPHVFRDALRGHLRNAGFAEAAPWLFIWHIALVMILCTLSQTKVWTYTLPAFPPLALLVGRWLAERALPGALSNLSPQPPSPKRRGGQGGEVGRSPFLPALVAFAGAALLAALGTSLVPVERLPSELRSGELLRSIRFILWLLAALSILLVAISWKASRRVTLASLGGGVAAWYVSICLLVLPAFDRVWKQPVREIAEQVKRHPGAKVATYHVHELSLNTHANVQRVEHLRKDRDRPALEALLRGGEPVFLLADADRLQHLEGLSFHAWTRSPRFVFGANFPPER